MLSPRYELDAPGYDPEAPATDGSEQQRHPRDPRQRPTHRERGPKRWPRARPGWSYQLVAEAAGVTIGAVKQAVRRGRLDMDDLGSVIDWASARRQRRRVKEATRR
mgnify:CR=1 FL=1